MKKILAMFAVVFMLTSFNAANADVYKDVPADYWDNKEITAVVNDDVLSLVGDAFYPENEVSRTAFNTALLKTQPFAKSARKKQKLPFARKHKINKFIFFKNICIRKVCFKLYPIDNHKLPSFLIY